MKRFELYNLLLPSARPFTSDEDLRDNISEKQERRFVEACGNVIDDTLHGLDDKSAVTALDVLLDYARKGVGR